MMVAQEQRVALVTGAASGIGAACAAELARRGWAVAGVDLTAPEGEGVALAHTADVSEPAQVQTCVERITDELGPVTAAVSAAGHYRITPVDRIRREEWREMIEVHLGGLANLGRAVLPAMAAAGDGTVVAVASELAIGGGDGEAHYAAAKGAVIGLVRALAVEYAPAGVRVNAVAPGPTDTPLLAADSPWRDPAYLGSLPARRLTTPYEVALACAFLVDEGTFCCGEVLSPNAGAVI